jgi:hypothetical protein
VVTLLTVLSIGVISSFATESFFPYATEVVSYEPGEGAGEYTNSSTVLGKPTVTNPDPWWGDTDVTMFNPPWMKDQIVSVGAGGHLVVKFNHPVIDNPTNKHCYGIDLLIFGNSFFVIDWDPQSTTYMQVISILEEPANVEVSQDGITWYSVTPKADSLFPTQAHTDSGPFGASPRGITESNFCKPVNPNITIPYEKYYTDFYADMLALYDGSGGGTGVDISETGLPWIRYVRVSLPADAGYAAEIDAFSDVVAGVPSPPA